MKDLSPYLQKAKEQVFEEMKYDNWYQLTNGATPQFLEDVLNRVTIVALQAQAEEFNKQSNETSCPAILLRKGERRQAD